MLKVILCVIAIFVVAGLVYTWVPGVPEAVSTISNPIMAKAEPSNSLGLDLGLLVGDKSPVYDAQGKAIDAAIPGNVDAQNIQNDYNQKLLAGALPGAIAAENASNEALVAQNALEVQDRQSGIQTLMTLRTAGVLFSIAAAALLFLVLANYLPKQFAVLTTHAQTEPSVKRLGTWWNPIAFLLGPSVRDVIAGKDTETKYLFPGLPSPVSASNPPSNEVIQAYMWLLTLKSVMGKWAGSVSRQVARDNSAQSMNETIQQFRNLMTPIAPPATKAISKDLPNTKAR